MVKSVEGELITFFRANTGDLPGVTHEWFQLPGLTQGLTGLIKPEELIGRVQAGEDIGSILGMRTPAIEPRAQGFIDRFVYEIDVLVAGGRVPEAVHLATSSLNTIAKQFSGTDLSVARQNVYEERAGAQRYLVERGSRRVRSFCALSTTADLMRADLESGQVTSRGDTIAWCFGYARMGLLQKMVVEKVAGDRLEKIYENIRGLTHRQIRRIPTPTDPEVLDMQKRIVAIFY